MVSEIMVEIVALFEAGFSVRGQRRATRVRWDDQLSFAPCYAGSQA
jgi:hypothetical protein